MGILISGGSRKPPPAAARKKSGLICWQLHLQRQQQQPWKYNEIRQQYSREHANQEPQAKKPGSARSTKKSAPVRRVMRLCWASAFLGRREKKDGRHVSFISFARSSVRFAGSLERDTDETSLRGGVAQGKYLIVDNARWLENPSAAGAVSARPKVGRASRASRPRISRAGLSRRCSR